MSADKYPTFEEGPKDFGDFLRDKAKDESPVSLSPGKSIEIRDPYSGEKTPRKLSRAERRAGIRAQEKAGKISSFTLDIKATPEQYKNYKAALEKETRGEK